MIFNLFLNIILFFFIFYYTYKHIKLNIYIILRIIRGAFIDELHNMLSIELFSFSDK
jgi:hypothetical protein